MRKEESRPTVSHHVGGSLRSANWWIMEVLSLVISAGALVAIAVFLSSLDNKPQPSWATAGSHCMTVPGSTETVCRGVGISVNSVVSWLGTVARICLLVPLSNGLGQLKWTWFSEGRKPLVDLETFDSASRGFSGSMQLIWRLKARYMATLGALGIILGVAFDPFIQNLVGYYTKSTLDRSQSAFVSNNSLYDVPPLSNNNYLVGDPLVKANVYNALYSSDPQQVWSQPHHVCSTGDCTWEPVASIGMCADCNDVTHLINESCDLSDFRPYENCTLSLPGSQNLPALDAFYLYADGKTPLGRFFTIASSGGKADVTPRHIVSMYVDIDPQKDMQRLPYSERPRYAASNCTLIPCVQSIRSTFKQSSQAEESPYKEEILKTWKTGKYNSPGYVVETSNSSDHGLYGQTFGFEARTIDGIFNFISDNFYGYYENQGTQSFFGSGSTDGSAPDAVSAIWFGNYTGCDTPSNRISCAMELTAKAMSKTIRDRPYTINGTQGTAGAAFSPVIHVRVTWYWISLPVAMWVLALVTFMGAAWKSSRSNSHVWRNSQLPLVFMRLDRESYIDGGDGVSAHALSKRAKALSGKLLVEDGQIRFTK